MMIIRPSHTDDLDDLQRLAALTGAGFTSLNPDRKLLTERLAASARAFAGELDDPRQAQYLFALEDTADSRLAGVCGIKASVGLNKPFYSYRVGLEINATKSLNIRNELQTLYLCGDYAGSAEIGSLFLDPDYRRRRMGALLSKSRFLFMAEHGNRLPDKVIAEMRGVSDEHGRSPFWESLGQHFLSMEFTQADYLSGGGDNAFIAELMPRHPIYVTLLNREARAVIGQVHQDTGAARRILEDEGFRFQNYVDIFDAGPTLEVLVHDIHSVRESRRATARVGEPAGNAARPCLVANTRLAGFRCTAAELTPDGDIVTLEPELAAALQVTDGDDLRLRWL